MDLEIRGIRQVEPDDYEERRRATGPAPGWWMFRLFVQFARVLRALGF